jgi:hypothetical protein
MLKFQIVTKHPNDPEDQLCDVYTAFFGAVPNPGATVELAALNFTVDRVTLFAYESERLKSGVAPYVGVIFATFDPSQIYRLER